MKDFMSLLRAYVSLFQTAISIAHDPMGEKIKIEKPKKLINQRFKVLQFTYKFRAFFREHICPYAGSFNDKSIFPTSISISIGNTSAESIRTQFFQGFARLAYITILLLLRPQKKFPHFVIKGISFAARKALRIYYSYLRLNFLDFWLKIDFLPLNSVKAIRFFHQEYTAVSKRRKPHLCTASLGDGPYVIIRPEGEWDRSGILESFFMKELSRPELGEKFTEQMELMQPPKSCKKPDREEKPWKRVKY
jgi:hypothetical protein